MRIFVIEDNPVYSEMLSAMLSEDEQNQVETFTSGNEALDFIAYQPQIITLDYALPDLDGASILKQIKEKSPNSNVVIVSGQENVSTALNLLEQGAYTYIVKDNDTHERLKATVENIKNKLRLEKRVETLEAEVSKKYKFNQILKGKSDALQRVFELMEKAVSTNINVSITGETGTGKELVAKSIHYNSNCAKKDFIAVNVTAIPSDLIESELFGHEKGAFTGAQQKRIGKFEEAHGGTIFLDEIGEMDINLQTKLLRVLQEKEIIRIGSNKPLKVDVRLLTATNKNLEKEIEKGNFREDLYFRLMGLPIELPPLRERDNDILFLARYFIVEFCKENNLEEKNLSDDAQRSLLKYSFPGNVRELKAMIELAVVMSNGNTIALSDLKFKEQEKSFGFWKNDETLQSYIAKIVQHYLDHNNANVIKVAQKLDVGKSTIYRMVNRGEVSLKK